MAISDLTGTTWLINSTPNIPNFWSYFLTFRSNNIDFTIADIRQDDTEKWITYHQDNAGTFDIQVYYWYNNVGSWSDESYRTIQITGGTDVTNATLIAWLEANAEQKLYISSVNVNNKNYLIRDDEARNILASISLPTPTSADNGKAISVDSSGNYVLANKMTNPMTTAGDLIVGGNSGTPVRLGIGSNGQVLTSNGTTASWQNPIGGVISLGGATGAITLGSGLSMVGNQLTLSITSYDGTVIELGYSGNITAQSAGGGAGVSTSIKFGSTPSSNNDYDSSVNTSGIITGDTTYSNETKVYVWGTNSGVTINSTDITGGSSYSDAVEVTLTGNYDIALWWNTTGGADN